jgi:D-alanyl-D-alanine carboxypeptidase
LGWFKKACFVNKNTAFFLYRKKGEIKWRKEMHKIWRAIACAFCSAFFLLHGSIETKALADTSPPSIVGKHAVVIEADTGEVLFEKASHEKAYPASLTKVLTAILLDEKVPDSAVITTTPLAAEQEGSNGYFLLNRGEQLSKRDALYSMMVISANDAAMAVAQHIAGSEKNFAQLMNEKAKQLGLKNSHFVTPNGLHDPNHYTTAYDMALIVREALKHPNVAQAMGTKETTIHTNMRNIHIKNPSKIHDNPLVIAGKTGYTHAAGNNLAEVFEINGVRYIAVDMQSNLVDEYKDIQAMVTYAKDKVKLVTLKGKGTFMEGQAINGTFVPFDLAESISIPERMDIVPPVELRTRWEIPKEGIEQGQTGGYVDVYYKNEKIKSVPLIAESSARPPQIATSENNHAFLIGSGLLAVGFAYVVLYRRRKAMSFLE